MSMVEPAAWSSIAGMLIFAYLATTSAWFLLGFYACLAVFGYCMYRLTHD